ncbi:SDR family oxidoreductase [Mesorhizobium sp. DCY119]|uniref:SDR family NAD(P)-dependent oxidoreductase n=1 Tax=Mesorhizobium sp. DCY119 TaxID=2108445 RepID=UPI000E74FEA3|nr:SDR family oxidoreductase [Mesorhizobium sp. DCY119]RJG40853.1 SDR family oxidoreductase [Mesorhizobium sp. DCY119]
MSKKLGTAVVTGAAKGIGRGIVEHLAREGYHVVAVDRLDEVHYLAAGLRSSGADVDSAVLDIRDRAAIAELMLRHAPIDVIVNNAAITSTHRFEDLTEDHFRENFDINTVGTFIVAQEGARRMRNGGRIVNIASRSFAGAPQMAHYVASKTAVVGLTRAMAIDLSPRDIRVNAIAPGVVDTDMLHYMTPERQQVMLSLQLLGRIGQPEDIARAVSFLASPENRYITGQVLVVDGGRSLGQGQLPPEESVYD